MTNGARPGLQFEVPVTRRTVIAREKEVPCIAGPMVEVFATSIERADGIRVRVREEKGENAWSAVPLCLERVLVVPLARGRGHPLHLMTAVSDALPSGRRLAPKNA